MKILDPKNVAERLGKSVRWVYSYAGELGAARIGGSWIFTEEGLQDAIQRKRGNMAEQGLFSGQTIHQTVQNQKRSPEMGKRKTQGVKGVKQEDLYSLLT
ncbi:MAG: helix-turn-helix domain-containing protein [Desulfobacteraceae bacterium]|nr:MAG: helix-turn-helix domain-containing protein [Desulfobacteraceae bacterium]